MKKFISILLLSIMSLSLFAGEIIYKVDGFTGKVTYEVSNGEWKDVYDGLELNGNSKINVGLNSMLILFDGKLKRTVKAMSRGTVTDCLVRTSVSNGIKKTAVLKPSNVADATNGTTKGVATAASRASDAKEDIAWAED